jgi:excisionase family DNA binding protein
MKKTLEPPPMRVGVAAHRLGLHPLTVRRWIKLGKIKSFRVGREARIPAVEIARLLGELPKSVVVLYGRVSGHDQQDDLQSQMDALRTWAKRERPGQEIVELADIGSGLKADRKQLRRMFSMIQNDRVAEVVVTYADRLTRFGLEYLTLFFSGYDVRFTVLHANEGKTPEQELTDDLIAILTSFSGRLYGMRSHKQKEIAARIEEALQTS